MRGIEFKGLPLSLLLIPPSKDGVRRVCQKNLTMNMHYDVIICRMFNMKKWINTLVILIAATIPFSGINGQVKEPSTLFRHVEGVQGIELAGGISDLGLAGSISYFRYFSHRWFGKASVNIEKDVDPRFISSATSIDLVISSYAIIQKSLFLYFMAGPTIVIENLKQIEWKHDPLWLGVGIASGTGLEYYLWNRLGITMIGLLRYVPNSSMGAVRSYLTAGMKYTF